MSEQNSITDCNIRKKKTFLKCSAPLTITLPAATETGTTFTAASLEVDISQIRNPCIYFEFVSNIIMAEAILNIDFQIFRLCKDQPAPAAVSPIWRYSAALPVTSGDTFSFSACSCSECGENCCHYRVNATVTGGAGSTAGVTSLKNMTLSALVTERH